MVVQCEMVEKGNFGLQTKSKSILPWHKGLCLLVCMTFYSTLSPYLQALSVSRSPQVEKCLYSWLFTETQLCRASSGPSSPASASCGSSIGPCRSPVLSAQPFYNPPGRVSQGFSDGNSDNWQFWHQEQKNPKEHKLIPTKWYDWVRAWRLDFLHRKIQTR